LVREPERDRVTQGSRLSRYPAQPFACLGVEAFAYVGWELKKIPELGRELLLALGDRPAIVAPVRPAFGASPLDVKWLSRIVPHRPDVQPATRAGVGLGDLAAPYVFMDIRPRPPHELLVLREDPGPFTPTDVGLRPPFARSCSGASFAVAPEAPAIASAAGFCAGPFHG
jgi:hypothetical protein